MLILYSHKSLENKFKKIPFSYHDFPNAHIDALLHSGTYTIRQIEKRSPEVGEGIRYAILRRDLEYLKPFHLTLKRA